MSIRQVFRWVIGRPVHTGGYITDAEHAEMTAQCDEIGRMLGVMLQSAEKFLTADF